MIPRIIGFLGALGALVRPAGAATRVACVGDSITAGSGLASGEAYPEVMGRLLGEDWLVGNFGLSATTAMRAAGAGPSYWSTGQFAASRRFNPEIVVIMLGTNDTKPPNWRGGANRFEDDYRALVDGYRALPRRPRVFVALPPPALADNFGISGKVIEDGVNPAVRRVAQATGAQLIDVHAAFEADARFFARGQSPLGDGVHPNAEGARLIAGTVAAAIQPAGCHLGPGRPPGGAALLLLVAFLTRLRL